MPIPKRNIDPHISEGILKGLKELNPQVIYLYGSHGTSRERSESDLDLGILCPDPLDPVRRFELAQDLALGVGKEVDLVDLSQADTVLQSQVVSTGTVIHVTDQKRRQEFEMYAYSDYARLNEERAEILRRIREAPF